MENNKSIILKLNNIGMIKDAILDINGLSVIAGKNDQGKSTVGKALMALIKADNMGKKFQDKNQQDPQNSKEKKKSFDRLISLLFDGDISRNGKISLKTETQEISIQIKNDECIEFANNTRRNTFLDCTFVQSPLVWDLFEFFSSIKTLEVENSFYLESSASIKYPYVLWDLYKKLTMRRQHKTPYLKEILESAKSVMQGQFIKRNDKIYFMRPNAKGSISEIQLKNIATGIKSFGIIQTLLENSYVTPLGFFIFDEPENHLHPVWQVAFAEILIKLIKKNICIMINTHSPYMLEALQKYSQKYKREANFYLADNGEIKQINNDNNATLEVIYQKLNESFVEMDKIEEEA